MEKSTSKERIYLDYNATSPLSSSVTNWLRKGDFVFANPSSIHSSGKRAKRQIAETTEYLHELFGTVNSHELFYHSGASEGINTFIKGFAIHFFKMQKKAHFFYASSDHSCVVRCSEDFSAYGHQTHCFAVDSNGEFDRTELMAKMQALGDDAILFNYTLVNNESGVVWPLSWAREIKEKTNCFVHVDGVQGIGKIDRWWELDPTLDAYTFSGHKFGALKGIGWSFVTAQMPFYALVRGGGQQHDRRSGTENVPAIISLRLALSDLRKNFNYSTLKSAKEYFLLKLKRLLGEQGIIIGENAEYTNANTVYFVLKTVKADIVTTAFDLAGIEISSGSACSSGATLPSRVLLAMGFDSDRAKSGLRFSFSSYFTESEVDEIFPRVQTILARFFEDVKV